jgi:anionic cell wall polymer biosynthesis LytR-Cps2A-Psr (LCP) family protein
MKERESNNSILLLALIVFIVVGGAVFAVVSFSSDPFRDALAKDRVVNTAFIFENEGKPISTYVVMFYMSNKRAAVFDVPSEIGLILRQINRVDRIDTIYKSHSISDYENELEKLLGVDIQYSRVFNMDNLGKLVDLIDGVDLFIPQPVSQPATEYNDVPVFFPSGFTNLDGEKIKQYLLYEDSENKIENVKTRRQRFFSAFLQKLGSKNAYLKDSKIEKILSPLITTSMSAKTRRQLLEQLSGIDTERLLIQVVAGNLREVSGQYLLFPYYDGALIKEIVRQTLATLTRTQDSPNGDKIFTVEVLNGTQTAGLAARTAALIGGFGYDVINVGNADHSDYAQTIILDHLGLEAEAAAFGDVIRCKKINVSLHDSLNDNEDNGTIVTMQDFEIKADFTLIIGRDFNGRYATN